VWFKYILAFFIFWLSIILQTSFLAHFSIFGGVVNLVFVLFFLFTFFENPGSYFGVINAILAGFFLDVFSHTYFGLSIASLALIYFMNKYGIYILDKKKDKFPAIYFVPLFLISFILHNLILNLSSFNLSEIIYNLAVSLLLFYLYKKFAKPSQ